MFAVADVGQVFGVWFLEGSLVVCGASETNVPNKRQTIFATSDGVHDRKLKKKGFGSVQVNGNKKTKKRPKCAPWCEKKNKIP